MKNVIISLFLTLILSTSLYAGDKEAFVRNMAHTNPVPNYMSIIAANTDKLALSADQKTKVMAWKKKNGAKMATMVNSIVDGEKKIKLASMDGVSSTKIVSMADQLMDTRKKIIVGKTTCRDYMMDVLSPEQWKQLTDIIKAG